MDIYTLKKPDLKLVDGAKVLKVFAEDKTSSYLNYIKSASEPRYLYWDKIQYKQKPLNLTYPEFWYLIKQSRKLTSRNTVIQSQVGDYFSWIRLPYTDEFLHKIDIYTGGQVFINYETLSEENKQKFVARGIIEEAIASSQLEGAHTTRQAAKQMILENRQPRNSSERMILNNYKVMSMLDENYKKESMSLELLFELHSLLVEGEVPVEEQNRLRKDSDEIIVGNDTQIAYIPPNEKFLASEIQRLIGYANDEDSREFVHPVIKAIFLHFWIAYLHPFTNGNGRLARAIFYWYLLKKGYWTFMYLPISSVIKKSPSQYAKAYIYTEQDDLDLTYFYDYHMRKIMQALNDFNEYVDKKILENRRIDIMLGRYSNLNSRQKQLTYYLLSEGDHAEVTIVSHKIINNISRETAQRDLKHLEKLGFVDKKRSGKFVNYYASSKLYAIANHKIIV